MFLAALRSGEHFSLLSWVGLTAAVCGLVYLVSPGLAAPDPVGASLMAVAGLSWGFYSLLGKAAGNPLSATANNFIWSCPLALITSLLSFGHLQVSGTGILLSATSGAITSGLGYVIWYAALRELPATRAATVQLSVPIIASIGGAIFLSESLTSRMIIASLATLGGISIVLSQRAAKGS